MLTVILSYIIIPLIILAFSAFITLIFALIFSKKLKTSALVAVIAVMMGFLIALSSVICVLISRNPVIVCPDEYSSYMNAEREQEIKKTITGLYKNAGLLFPYKIEVKYMDEKASVFEIRYFFSGTVKFSVDEDGVKNIDKPLY